MTDIEEQIQEALKSTGVLRFPGDRFSLAAAVMPLVKRAQAEALREAATWVENLAAHDGVMYREDNDGDLEAASIPDALRDRADRIEKEAGA